MFRHFFGHPAIWLYFILLATVLVFIASYYGDVFITYWWAMLIPIGLAPFFEWFAHKYILHLKIGKVKEVELSELNDPKVGDNIRFENSDYKVMSIENGKAILGFGLAPKLPKFINDGMYVLHYGHHEDPNNVKLIFAPITFSVGLFVLMFAGCYLVTFNEGISLIYVTGVIAYYIYYEWVHLGHHVADYKPITNWSKNLKKAHMFHHYRNENQWWGITNSLGDYVLGTYKNHEDVNQSPTTMDINN